MINFGFKWIAQNEDGSIFIFKDKPEGKTSGVYIGNDYKKIQSPSITVKDWQNRIVNLETHWFKIEDMLLVQTNKRPHADLACKYFLDDNVEIEIYSNINKEWEEINKPGFLSCVEYREKPSKNKDIWYRNYLDEHGEIKVLTNEACDLDNNSIATWIDKPRKLKHKK